MMSGARTAVTLAVLCVLLVAGAVYGWSRLTAPLPGRTDLPPCVDTTYSAGDTLYPSQVVISVLNAGRREGLAGRTMSQLVDHGFVEGSSGNAPQGTAVKKVQIWTADPANPAVALLAAHLGKPQIVQQATTLPGVVVVVGDEFQEPVAGPGSVTVEKDAVVCSPPA
jgi:hypothetical protein